MKGRPLAVAVVAIATLIASPVSNVAQAADSPTTSIETVLHASGTENRGGLCTALGELDHSHAGWGYSAGLSRDTSGR
jgi:hypothetical protein